MTASRRSATGNGPNPLYYFNGPPALSADGRYVAFASSAVNLVPGVPRNPVAFLQDVFVRDLQRGQSTLVSSGPYRWSGGAVSADVAFSADGRYVAFSALGQLTDQYSPAGGQIYVRDWRTGATRLASIGPNGTGGNTPSFSPSASSNGQVVAFTSPAVNLFAGPDTNANFDVFAWQAASGTAQLVSVNRTGTGTGNGRSLEPILSANGRLVAFSSEASDLVNNDTNGWQDVFVRDLLAGTTVLISVNQSGTSGGLGHSHNPVFSADGRYVAFTSTAGDLVPGDGNGTEDVFVRDLLLGTTRLVSVNEAGTGSGNSFSSRPSISADNRYVAFQSAASDLAPGNPSSLYNVFLRDLVSGTTTLVSTRCDGTRSGNALSWHPALSANGRYVAFTSLATDLTGDPVVPAVENVFRRDLLTGLFISQDNDKIIM